MRIGKFAEEYQLSLDTIRHYMDLGLIVPEKKGGQYFFDQRCRKDLEFVLELKGMGFSLLDIKTIFHYRNFGKLTDYEENAYYQSLFIEKYKKLEEEIDILTGMRVKLKSKLDDLSEKNTISSTTTGIDFKVLDLLKCLNCSGPLTLLNGRINRNQIIEGRLACDCGEEYEIDSGILIVGKPHESEGGHLSSQNIANYIQSTDSGYLENLNKGLQWASRKMTELDLHQKVLLELGSGAGFFLRNIYQQLPEDCLYIAVDHNLEKHQFLKDLIERSGSKRKVLFICTDFLKIPLQEQSVDVLLDASGTSNYSFNHEEFLLREINSLLKPEGHLLASFIVFKNFSHKSKVESRFRDHFTAKKIKENILKLRYVPLEELTSLPIDKGGMYENFFIEGEEIFTYSFFGKRLG